jgi:hypothetical protein
MYFNEIIIFIIINIIITFHKKLIFYGEELLAPSPTPELEDQN